MEICWFEVEFCYIYYLVNVWEEDGVIVMIGCCCDDLMLMLNLEDGCFVCVLVNLCLSACLYWWCFDFEIGVCIEEIFDDCNVEFFLINVCFGGCLLKFSYYMVIFEVCMFFFDGIVKYGFRGELLCYMFGFGVFGSEVLFVLCEGVIEEDDGYLLSFVQDIVCDVLEFWIYDVRVFEEGFCCKVVIP